MIKSFFFLCSLAIMLENCNPPKIVAGVEISSVNELSKYSYKIFGVQRFSDNRMLTAYGTGFFVRENDSSLFFVTAKHVLVGCDNYSDEIRTKGLTPPFMSIIFEDSAGKATSRYEIDCREIIQRENCEDPDVIRVKVPNHLKVNTVNQFIVPEYKETSDIEIFGFPSEQDWKGGRIAYARASHIHLDGGKTIFRRYVKPKTGVIDTMNYSLKNSSFIIRDSSMVGYSGSPVFIQDKKSNKWRIGGALISRSEKIADSSLIFVDIKFALK